MPLLPLVCVALLALPCAGQEPWQLPHGGAVRYFTTEDFEPEHAGPLPGTTLPHAPVLLHSELAKIATHVGIDPQDWRWIAPLLAFDLRLSPGKVDTKLERVPHLGDLQLRGTATAGDDGALRLQLQLTVLTNKSNGFGGSGTATARIERSLQNGVVTAFRAETTFDLRLGPRLGGAPLIGTFVQDWRLDRVIAHRENGFHQAVGHAITAGCEALLHALQPDRPEFRTQAARNDHPCGEGRLALGIQTLLTAGHAADDPKIVAALDELRRRKIVETYSLASAILVSATAFGRPEEGAGGHDAPVGSLTE